MANGKMSSITALIALAAVDVALSAPGVALGQWAGASRTTPNASAFLVTLRASAISTRRRPNRTRTPPQAQERRNDASRAAIDRDIGFHFIAAGHSVDDGAGRGPRCGQQRPARRP